MRSPSRRSAFLRLLALTGLVAGSAGLSGCAEDNDDRDATRVYRQVDRLARPVVNEALATVAGDRHKVNNEDNPSDDAGQLAADIRSFLAFPAGRSQAIENVIVAVLVPDVLRADLSQPGPAAYLGVETGGATGRTFGGRALTDDVVDISLGVVFGDTVAALGLAPDDGKAIATLTSDNVGPEGKGFNATLGTFPYLGTPR